MNAAACGIAIVLRLLECLGLVSEIITEAPGTLVPGYVHEPAPAPIKAEA